jgi:Right handed beta helix region
MPKSVVMGFVRRWLPAVVCGGACWVVPAASSSAPICDRVAAPGGADSAAGSQTAPFRTLTRLERSLSPGQTGCLRAGTYGSPSTEHSLSASGARGAPVTITAYRGDRPKVRGYVVVQGSWVTVSHLTIDGDNTFFRNRRGEERGCAAYRHPVSEAMDIEGDHVVFEDSELYQSVPARRGVGLGIGFSRRVAGVIVRHDRIHGVGSCKAFDHVIYAAHTAGGRIVDNWLYDDPHGWGVHLYPSALHMLVAGNVIAHTGSGVVVGGECCAPSSDNVITHNVITNSTGLRAAGLARGVAVSTYWGGPIGTGNRFVTNLSWRNPGGDGSGAGVLVARTAHANPRFVDARADDYRLARASPAHAWMSSTGRRHGPARSGARSR